MVCACDEKIAHSVGRRSLEMKVQGRRKIGRPKRRWLDRVRDDIEREGTVGWLMKCTNLLHGSTCHRTPTPHKVW